jgi:hypothetical protein
MSVPDLSASLIKHVVEGFDDFLNSRLPKERLRWSLDIDRDPEPREQDDGYVRKDGERGADRKGFFHYRSDFESQLLRATGIRPTNIERIWLQACQDLLTTCSCALLRLAREMDREQPGFDFAERTTGLAHLHVIRIVRYDAGYQSLARMHQDRCAITFHLAESEPGLEVREGFGKKLCVSPKAPQVLTFPGGMLEHITEGAIPALWHGAREQSGSSKSRWVVVFFGKMKKYEQTF